ncbi:hypothetical protein F4815DRAFT_157391 [Daldinia loculata]|nr:hypothetical protein F4815DRAFT_157391 [Daldinia loculata]
MSTADLEYSADAEITTFFTKTSATRAQCDSRAAELAGDDTVVPVKVQGVCSYSVYAGRDQEYVVQFRLRSLELRMETAVLAREVYGELAPTVSFEGQMGADGDGDGKEGLCVYLMSRVRGVTHLDFILAYDGPDNSQEWFGWRRNLMVGVARFFALSWNAPQQVSPEDREKLRGTYVRELRLLYSSLPDRFRPIIQNCIDSIDTILSLPMVLLHRDFGTCNIIVDETSCHLVGVVDWAEAEICPFGLNLHSLEALTGKLRLRDGWSRYEDYATLQDVFWSTFAQQVGGVDEDTVQTIKLARITGLLLSAGFTSRLANEPALVPICDDEIGRYKMLSLDGFLINLETRFKIDLL